MHVGPLCFVALAVLCWCYAAWMGARIGRLRVLLHASAVLCVAMAAFYGRDPRVFACGIVGVSEDEIRDWADRFERAVERAGLSLKEVAVVFYGKDDQARLRHELNEGLVKSVHCDKLPPAWHLAWWEQSVIDHDLARAAEDRARRAATLVALLPKPQPVSMELEGVCQRAAS